MTGPGIVKTEWIMNGQGTEKSYIWCENWAVRTDSAIAEELGTGADFKSREGWTLVGYKSSGDIAVALPGCRVSSWLSCAEKPSSDRILCL